MNRLRNHRDGGFSLVELLVTVVIIAVLAAIAIPLYTSQKNKAATATAQDDVRAAAMEISSVLSGYTDLGTTGVFTASGGTLTVTFTGTPVGGASPNTSGSVRTSTGYTLSGNVVGGAVAASGPQFCVKVSNGTQYALATQAGLFTTDSTKTTCTAGVPA